MFFKFSTIFLSWYLVDFIMVKELLYFLIELLNERNSLMTEEIEQF